MQSLNIWEKIVIICGVVCLKRGQREIEVSIMVVMVHGYKKSSWQSQQQKTKSSNIRDAHLTCSFFLPSLAKLHLNKNISSIGSLFLCDGFCQTIDKRVCLSKVLTVLHLPTIIARTLKGQQQKTNHSMSKTLVRRLFPLAPCSFSLLLPEKYCIVMSKYYF